MISFLDFATETPTKAQFVMLTPNFSCEAALQKLEPWNRVTGFQTLTNQRTEGFMGGFLKETEPLFQTK